MGSLAEMISKGCRDESAQATAVRQRLKTVWDAKIKDAEEKDLKTMIKVWRGRWPQQKQRHKAKHAKLILCCSPELQEPLLEYLALTGATEKVGKAPKGWLEREAANLLKKLGK